MESNQADSKTTTNRNLWLHVSPQSRAQWGVITAVFVGVGLVLLTQLFLVLLTSVFSEQIEQNQLLRALRNQLLLGGSLIPLVVYFIVKKMPFFKSVLVSKFKAPYLGILLKGAGIYLLLTAVGLTLLDLVVPGALEVEQDIGVASGDPASVLIITFISVVVVAPFVEEILFRGFIFRGFERTIGFGLAVVASSLLFGLLHGSLAAVVDTFALGVVGCLLVARSGSLWPAILLHGLKNAIVYYNRFIEPLI